MKIRKTQLKKPDKYLQIWLNTFKSLHLSYSGDLVEELWNTIEHYSEIDRKGIKLIQSNGSSAKDAKDLQVLFRSRIKQAKNYYNSALALPNISAPVLYYYSFYNLACALIVSRGTKIDEKKCNHGLKYDYEKVSKLFKNEVLTIKDSTDIHNIFPLIYEIVVGKKISINNLNISNILSYCTDIAYQYEESKFGLAKVHLSKAVILSSNSNKKAWSLVAIPNKVNISKYSKSFRKFINEFNEVDLLHQLALQIFEFDPNEMKGYRYFQSEWEIDLMGEDTLPHKQIVSKLTDSISEIYYPSYFKNYKGFNISLPLRQNYQEPFNEVLAIFACMFYLSCLVRYKPEYLDKIYSNNEMWLINAFIYSCPSTFLRIIISNISKTDYVLSPR